MIVAMERPAGPEDDRPEPWEDDNFDPPVGGLVARLVPLGIAVVLLVTGLARAQAPSRSPGAMAGGLGVVLLATLLHVLALRYPRRQALDGTAWAVSIVAVLVALGFGLAPSLR
jgi:hypothetical protein